MPILYSFRRCPYAMRAHMALWASGQAYALREVVLKDKPAHMLELSPKGTVPVLLLPSGDVIDESLSVMAWALGQNDPLGWLDTTAEAGALVQACDADFKSHLDRYKYASRYEDSDPLAHRQAGEQFVGRLDAILARSAHLSGECQTLADIAIAPFVRQFALADWDWFFDTPYVSVQRWLSAFIDTPPFTAVMDKFPPWRPGDDETIIRP